MSIDDAGASGQRTTAMFNLAKLPQLLLRGGLDLRGSMATWNAQIDAEIQNRQSQLARKRSSEVFGGARSVSSTSLDVAMSPIAGDSIGFDSQPSQPSQPSQLVSVPESSTDGLEMLQQPHIVTLDFPEGIRQMIPRQAVVDIPELPRSSF